MNPTLSKNFKLPIAAMCALSIIFCAQMVPNASAADDPSIGITQTTISITYSGVAQISASGGIYQDIQIQQPTIDFGPQQPIMWDVNVDDSVGNVLADISWFYSATAPGGFTYSLGTGNKVNSNGGGTNCVTTPITYCTNFLGAWTISNPTRVSFGPDSTLGLGWWKATVTDLKTGSKIDLGSIKDIYPQTPRTISVQDNIYRSSINQGCPGDAAPVADTYFGPIVDSTGAEELLPTLKTTSNPCINASLSTLPTIVGGFLLYGGSKADLSTAPRANLFTPSPLITSAIPPTPDVPTNFVETANNGVLKLIVQVPNFQSKGIKSIYLVSPELGFPSATPINTNVIGDTGQISFPILPGFINTPINLSFYASNGYFVSDPFTTSITIPPAASPPVQVPGIGGAHSVPGGITNAPTTSEVPSAPQGIKTSIAKGQLIITANSVQRNGTKVSGALLVSTPLGFTSSAPKQGTVTSGKLQFKVALTKAMSGKTIPFTIYLYNDLGVSGASTGKVKVP